jgi:methionine-rich copper-binding protein CopC
LARGNGEFTMNIGREMSSLSSFRRGAAETKWRIVSADGHAAPLNGY